MQMKQAKLCTFSLIIHYIITVCLIKRISKSSYVFIYIFFFITNNLLTPNDLSRTKGYVMVCLKIPVTKRNQIIRRLLLQYILHFKEETENIAIEA